MSAGPETDILDDVPIGGRVHRFRLAVVEGPATGAVWEGGAPRCAIGTGPDNDLVVDDPTVSRFHCEVVAGPRGLWLRDLGSKNGTALDGVPVLEVGVRHGSLIRCGRTVVRCELADATIKLPLSERDHFGDLVGRSIAMRAAFAVLERAAASDVTVLIEGETGTGKEGAARALHRGGRRAGGPMLVVDCGAIPGGLVEGELFGHEKGAYTGAVERRAGVFEAASGGTVFLDEIGELPLDVQPKLLRVLEEREVRRLGAVEATPVDVRVIAATNRDLRAEVNAGSFRADLYYRLAVVRVDLPALRQRPDDMPVLVDAIVTDLERVGRVSPALAAALRAPGFVAELVAAAWPGNVRELRNVLEQCAVLGVAAPPRAHASAPPVLAIDLALPFKEARQRVLDDFERRYLEQLVERHGGNISAAARHAGISRVSLYALLRRRGIR